MRFRKIDKNRGNFLFDHRQRLLYVSHAHLVWACHNRPLINQVGTTEEEITKSTDYAVHSADLFIYMLKINIAACLHFSAIPFYYVFF
jgi:hypothetical protein